MSAYYLFEHIFEYPTTWVLYNTGCIVLTHLGAVNSQRSPHRRVSDTTYFNVAALSVPGQLICAMLLLLIVVRACNAASRVQLTASISGTIRGRSLLCLWYCRLFIILFVTSLGLCIPLITKGFTKIFFLARTFGAGTAAIHHFDPQVLLLACALQLVFSAGIYTQPRACDARRSYSVNSTGSHPR